MIKLIVLIVCIYLFYFWAVFPQVFWSSIATCLAAFKWQRKKTTGPCEVGWVCSDIWANYCKIQGITRITQHFWPNKHYIRYIVTSLKNASAVTSRNYIYNGHLFPSQRHGICILGMPGLQDITSQNFQLGIVI